MFLPLSVDRDTLGTGSSVSISPSSGITAVGGDETVALDIGLTLFLLGGDTMLRLSGSIEPRFSLPATDSRLGPPETFNILFLLFSSSLFFAAGKYSPR